MAANRISMRKIKDILRLYDEAKLSRRQIASCLSLSRDTVAKTLERAHLAGLSWPSVQEFDDTTIERQLYQAPEKPKKKKRPLPDWSEFHKDLKRKGVTMQLLWEEYKLAHPDGYNYSWLCEQYRTWRKTIDVVMRQTHRAGEKVFVDYAGQTVPVVDAATGEVHEAQIFVAVLGASNYTYVEATWTQQLPDWIASHRRAFEFFGAVTELVIPDYVTRHIIGNETTGSAAIKIKNVCVRTDEALLILRIDKLDELVPAV